MSVVDIPVGSLDNETDLMFFLADELVANHRFTEEGRIGSIANNDGVVFLERPQVETFHNDAPMTFVLRKADLTEGSGSRSFTMNMSPTTYVDAVQIVSPLSVIVDFDTGQQELVLQGGGAFTNWVSAGYVTGQYLRIVGAATGGNNGLFEIQTFSTTTLTNDTLEIRTVSGGGPNDFVAADVGDTITVSLDQNYKVPPGAPLNPSTGKFNVAPQSNDLLWGWGVEHMGATFPYLRARLITSPTSGSATPSEELYFYVIIEVDIDIYTKFGFGEVVKLLPWEGGHFVSGDEYNDALDMDTDNNNFLQGPAAAENYDASGNANNAPPGVWTNDWNSANNTQEFGFGWMLSPARGGASFDAPTHYTAAILPHMRGNGKEIFGYSPSPFSGQSERWPIYWFGGFNQRDYSNGTGAEVAPMAIFPDVFLAEITNVDAYSVFQDTFGEKFMVVPVHTKSGSGVGSSEKWGYLFRNPDLVVT